MSKSIPLKIKDRSIYTKIESRSSRKISGTFTLPFPHSFTVEEIEDRLLLHYPQHFRTFGFLVVKQTSKLSGTFVFKSFGDHLKDL